MDPVTIVGSVSAAIKTTYWISTTLYTLTNSSRGINKSLVDLHDEVEGLNVVLRSVELSLKKPSIACMKKDGENQGAWPSLNVAIRHTQLTVDGLKQIVERLGTVPKSANIFKKSVKQIHLNLNADEISGVKDRLRTHTANLQLALQLAILNINSQSSGNIQEIVSLMKKSYPLLEPSRIAAANHRLPTSLQNPDLSKHTEHLVSSASTVLSSKSTAWAGSELRFPYSSENGQPLGEAQKTTIEDWISHLASLEEESARTTDSHDTSAASETLNGEGRSLGRGNEASDSDSDDDYDLARKCLEKADQELVSAQDVTALKYFRAGFKRAETLSLKKQRCLEMRDVQLKMALCLLSAGELDESEQRFLSLARQNTKDDWGVKLALHASSGLTQIHLCRRSFAEAETWCRRARIGWRRVVGKEHPVYVDCLRLSAYCSELNGNHADATSLEALAKELEVLVDEGPETPKLLCFSIEKSRTLVTEYHQKALDDGAECEDKNSSPEKEQPGDLSANQELLGDVTVDSHGKSSIKSSSEPKLVSGAATTLHEAARRADTASIQRLLASGAKIDKVENRKSKVAPLHLAAAGGHTATVEYILDHRAKIDARDASKFTALMLAACYGHTATVKCLLDRGANIKVKDADRWTALLEAAFNGHTATIECLLDRGANIEAKAAHGRTALLEAAFNGHTATIECLLKRGASVFPRDRDGDSALRCTKFVKDKETRKKLVAMLEEHGAK